MAEIKKRKSKWRRKGIDCRKKKSEVVSCWLIIQRDIGWDVTFNNLAYRSMYVCVWVVCCVMCVCV